MLRCRKPWTVVAVRPEHRRRRGSLAPLLVIASSRKRRYPHCIVAGAAHWRRSSSSLRPASGGTPTASSPARLIVVMGWGGDWGRVKPVRLMGSMVSGGVVMGWGGDWGRVKPVRLMGSMVSGGVVMGWGGDCATLPRKRWCPHLIATLCIVVGAGHQRHSPPQAVVPPPHRYALHRRRRRSSAPLSPASGANSLLAASPGRHSRMTPSGRLARTGGQLPAGRLSRPALSDDAIGQVGANWRPTPCWPPCVVVVSIRREVVCAVNNEVVIAKIPVRCRGEHSS